MAFVSFSPPRIPRLRARGSFRACGRGSLLAAAACKGRFRAPARPTFAPVGKSGQKRRSNLRFENPLAPCTWRFLLLRSSRCWLVVNLSKCRIASAAIPAAAQDAKCRGVQFYISEQKRQRSEKEVNATFRHRHRRADNAREALRKSNFCRRAGSLETCGFKQPFWSLLGLRPKVTRARRRGMAFPAAGGSEWPRSKFQAPAVRQRRNFGHRNSAIKSAPRRSAKPPPSFKNCLHFWSKKVKSKY